MLTNREIMLGILMPLAIALIIGAIGWRTKRSWLLPLACGIGFLAGYAATGGFPRIPPVDGSDWLFWGSIPAIGLAMLSAALSWRWLAVLGAWAGAVIWLILHPLVPGAVSATAAIEVAITFGILGIVTASVSTLAADRIGHGSVTLALCIALGGVGITVLSSNLRTVGLYGIGAATALGGVWLFAPRSKAAGALSIFAAPVLTALLVANHYYADPGIGWLGIVVLALSPLLLLVGVWMPSNRAWVKGICALLAVTIAVTAVTAPAALAAKKAAEEDPYSQHP